MTQEKIIYWVSTGLMCALFAFSAGMYFLNYDQIVEVFGQLGFPAWVVYPLAIVKVLGIVAILSKQSKMLKEWAYAGFFFDAFFAFGAHHYAQDGEGVPAIIGIVLVIISRIYDGKLYR
ncbi:MAG: hypothetical protein ACI9FN_000706 [Saprospiraceae bacterium]|jgi:hypothetical protein